MHTNDTYKQYNSIDVLKLFLSVLVMIIHYGIDKAVISPVLRTAVPLFFIISSYFFFAKNGKNLSAPESSKALLKFIKRNLLLYLFWAVIQLPLQFFLRGYYQQGIYGILYSFKDVVLGSGFKGAWYILALIIGIVVIFWLSKRIPSMWLILLTLPLYIICCLVTNYYNLFVESSAMLRINNCYQTLTGRHFYTSFPVALFWISVGRFLSEKKYVIKTKILILVAFLSGGLLMLEYYWISKLGLAITDDCYFMLSLFCPIIFLLIIKSEFSFLSKFRIRELSVVIYVSHGCLERIVGYVLKRIPLAVVNNNVIKVVLSFIVAFLLCNMLIYLREKKHAPILKYAY